MQPDVSVVIPTYNRRSFLEEAIQSCFDGNEGFNVEVVVVDDGSTDGTREYLQQLSDERLRPIYQKHQGGQVARNRGLDEAQGEYVKFLDDDDWLAAGTLRKEVVLLRKTGADMCTGGCQFVDRQGQPLGNPDFPVFQDLLVACFEGTVGPQPLRHTYQTSFAQRLCWNEELPCRQDYGFILEAALERPNHVHGDIVTGYKRQHKGGLSESVESREESTMVHLRLLQEAAESLGDSEARVRRAAATGLWRWGRLNAVRNRQAFLETWSLIKKVCPDFLPPRSNWLLSISDRLFGAKTTELLLLPVRKIKTATGIT
jgi:glycosyltransferase involved in cell wall biosynthesis